MKLQAITHAYGHRLADVHLAGFAPAFTLSLCVSEYVRKPPVPIASVVSSKPKKNKQHYSDLYLKIDSMKIWEIFTTIITTISISGTIIWVIVEKTANILADKYKLKVEHDFEKKLENYKSELEILKTTTLKYNDKQFELYLELWKNLQNLKFSSIDLWKKANLHNLKKFEVALHKTYRQVETTSILIEENHYLDLTEIIKILEEFDTGKEKLIASRRINASEWEIQQIINFNRERKDNCLIIIEALKNSIKTKIRGVIN